jgi:hypothetical protein
MQSLAIDWRTHLERNCRIPEDRFDVILNRPPGTGLAVVHPPRSPSNNIIDR